VHPRLAELLDSADRTRNELLAFVGTLTPEQLQAPGPDGAWSPSQHLAHLHLVEASSLRALFRTFRTARAAGLAMETETSSLRDALDGTGLATGEQKRIAPDFVSPADAPDGETLRARLTESRAGLHAWAAEADGFALATVTFPHPVLGMLTLYEWIVMIDHHERRHLRQMRAQVGATRP
jgi:hypothetical protein